MVSTTDVAKHAGVSQTTVSRVLNKPDQVKKDTYDKVMAAVNELNYSTTGNEDTMPMVEATKTISLIAGSLDDSIFIGSAPAILNVAKDKGYQVNVHFVTKDNESETYDAILSSNVDGLIIASVGLDKAGYEKLNQAKVPFVLLNSSYPDSHNSIGLNNVEAGYLAASHLLENKHEEIAWIGGSLNNPSHKERFQGFVYALQEAGNKIRKKRLVIADTDKESLYSAFEDLQSLKKKPTAIVAATDEIAIQLMDFYLQAGYKIPKDVSIIGIGNSELGQHSSIGLTSVGPADSLDHLGQEAINRLLDMLTLNQDEAFHVSREVRLNERKSTLSL